MHLHSAQSTVMTCRQDDFVTSCRGKRRAEKEKNGLRYSVALLGCLCVMFLPATHTFSTPHLGAIFQGDTSHGRMPSFLSPYVAVRPSTRFRALRMDGGDSGDVNPSLPDRKVSSGLQITLSAAPCGCHQSLLVYSVGASRFPTAIFCSSRLHFRLPLAAC